MQNYNSLENNEEEYAESAESIQSNDSNHVVMYPDGSLMKGNLNSLNKLNHV